MKENNKHMEDIDQLLRQTLVTTYEPSVGFVDNVMGQVEAMAAERPASKVIKMMLQLAAASAILVFITNLFILISSSHSATVPENDWTTVYEYGSTSNWYDYNSEDTFIANNQTLK